MKYITFVIPCFNSAAYMKHCIDSCMVSNDVEILIIDDGSKKDNTYEIAKKYQEKYPDVCRAIHKANGGHGSVVNRGIKEAKGLYIKIVDSDDWLDKALLKKLVSNIKDMVEINNDPDLIITNFIYDKVDKKRKKVMKYNGIIPTNKILTWDTIRDFRIGHYLLMHSLMYKTEVLRKSKLVLPEHTFYVDNIYAYQPLPFVKTLIYYNYDLYHYYIGRSDQSVNEQVMISRLDQQYRVTYKMIDDVDLKNVKSKKLKKYMLSYLQIVIAISCILSIRSKDKKWFAEKEKLWKYIKNKDKKLYDKLFYTVAGIGVNLPTSFGRFLSSKIYEVADNIIGFN